MSRYKVWADRYETGWQDDVGVLDNFPAYFPKKWTAMTFVMRQVFWMEINGKPILSGYVYDRNLNFYRWYHQGKWTRKQPEPPLNPWQLHTGGEEYAE